MNEDVTVFAFATVMGDDNDEAAVELVSGIIAVVSLSPTSIDNGKEEGEVLEVGLTIKGIPVVFDVCKGSVMLMSSENAIDIWAPDTPICSWSVIAVVEERAT